MKQSRSNGDIRDSVQVHLAGVVKPKMVGTFYPSHGEQHRPHSFAYSPSWLHDEEFFDLDPNLQSCEGEQFPPPALPFFGMLRDATPDRWGRMLIDRSEAVAAKFEQRSTRKLDDVDYLLAVEDVTRIGALRFSRIEEEFLKESMFPLPNLRDLRNLAEICLDIDTPASEQHPEYASRLARLVSSSAALGGARPKASYLDTSILLKGPHQLWIAKFPEKNDEYDVGAWEFLLNQLARKAKIFVPDAKLLRLGGPYRTFCAERFDRVGNYRYMYASAMTCLGRQDGDHEASYLDIAELITRFADREMVRCQVEQLFRRVLFNVMAGNRDDHLRNHGFQRKELGWVLSRAFDMNPSPTRTKHAIRIDDSSAVPDVDRVIKTAEVYQLTRDRAAAILDEVASAVSIWRDEALRLQISRREIHMMQEAFA